MKYLLFVLFIIGAHYYTTAQLTINRYEKRSKKDNYQIEVKGTAYFTEDSIAIYLYEPLMESMVIYNITSQTGIFTGYLPWSKKPVKVWRWGNAIFLEYNKERTKLILK